MKISINAELNGKEIVENFIKQLKEQTDVPWKEGSDLPVGMKILVFSDKAGKDIEITPDKLKIVFNK
jgi:hypothetical protein